MSDYIGKRIVPKHCGEWDRAKEYEMLSIVLHTENGNSFITKRENTESQGKECRTRETGERTIAGNRRKEHRTRNKEERNR